jgi:hypothetical protein
VRKLILALCACSVSAWSQIGTSTITGRVSDTSNAIVSGVKVDIVQKSTNFTYNAVSNSDGLYRVPSLQPGEYRVTFEAPGFKKSVRDDIALRTGDTLAVDMTMQVGQLTESIEVKGTGQLLDTETSSTGTVMSGNVLYELPLYQRYVNATLNLVPGMSSGGFAYGGDLGSYHLAGQRNGAIGIFEDGVNGNDQGGGTGTIKPLQNSVAEVNVITTVAPAEYGHSAGGVISVVKKTGTNELHGMASWFGRTRSMQHRRYFDLKRTSDAYAGHPNGLPVFFMQPDSNISGPVVLPHIYNGKNKTFFFFGYQRLHEKKVAQVFTTVPTAAMLGGDFNFPGITANPIYDPATTRRNADGTWARDQFAGNIIPPSRFDPVAAKVIGFAPWVDPTTNSFTSGGPNNNVLANEFARTFFNDYNLRMDHQFSSAFKIYGSFTENDQSGFQRPVAIKDTRLAFDAAQGNYTPFTQNNSSVGYTWLPSPTLVNDSRVGYFRRRNDTSVPSFGGNWPSQLGIPNVDNALMPSFGVFNITGATPGKTVNETFSFRNDTTWVKGAHALKAGYEILYYKLNSANYARFASFAFDGVTSGLQPNGTAIPNTGITFAGFLTGYVRQATFNAELTSWLPRSNIHSFYLQDDWKITPTLTANLGVRYSNESPFHTKYGALSSFDPNGTDNLTGGKGAIIHPSSLANRDNNNFNPRIGLAWHPLQKIVLRGGFGMNTVDIKFPQSRGQFDEYTAIANQQAATGDPTPIYRISRGPDPVKFITRPNGTSPFVGTNYGSRSVEWWDNNLRNPYVLNFNASAQYEFRKNYLLELSYQGSSGVGLLERWQVNSFPIDYFAGNATQQNIVNAGAQNYRPFPQFGDIRLRSNFGHSTFHSGTVKLEKHMSDGLYFQTFYTLGKAIDSQDNDNDGTGVAPLQNRSLEKGRAGFDRKHRFIGVLNYELPFGPGKKWATGGISKWLLGGFELSWIQTQESGNPLTFSYAGSPYNYYPGFAGNTRPDVTGPISIRDGWYDLGGNRFVNANISSVFSGGNNGLDNFALPGGCPTVIPAGFDRSKCDFRIGNAGRNIIDGLPLRWSQASAQKNFRIKEKYKAQLRWDMQNIFKRYNFNPPTSTVDFRPSNIPQFGKVSSDPTTASLGGQPLMNLTLMVQF